MFCCPSQLVFGNEGNILQHKFVHKLSHKAQNYKKIYSKQTLISIIVLILRMFYVSISLHRIVRCIITKSNNINNIKL